MLVFYVILVLEIGDPFSKNWFHIVMCGVFLDGVKNCMRTNL